MTRDAYYIKTKQIDKIKVLIRLTVVLIGKENLADTQ